MSWPSVDDITARAPLPAGYHYEYLRREQVPMLISALETWYPAIGVGNASCHLRDGSTQARFVWRTRSNATSWWFCSCATASWPGCSLQSGMRIVGCCMAGFVQFLQTIEAHI